MHQENHSSTYEPSNYAIKFSRPTRHFAGLSRITLIFKYFQGIDFATFKFNDIQGPGGTLNAADHWQQLA